MTEPKQASLGAAGGRVSETRFSLLEARVGGIETALNSLASKIDSWMASRNQGAWRTLGFIAAVLIPLAFVVNLYITSAISPWAAISNQAKATTESNTAQILRGSEIQTGILQEMARNNAERQANEREVETQIDAMAQILSIQFATQQRLNADFQNALHESGAKMPAAPTGPFYFPNISNRNHRKQ